MPAVLVLHSVWRWVLLVAGLAAIGKALAGWLGRQPFEPLDRQLGAFYTIALDLQVLLGLILWIGERWWASLASGAAMSVPQTRFFVIEHPFVMILAVAVAHAGRTLSRKAAAGADAERGASLQGGAAVLGAVESDVAAHRYAALFYLLSFLMILALIPWDRLFR